MRRKETKFYRFVIANSFRRKQRIKKFILNFNVFICIYNIFITEIKGFLLNNFVQRNVDNDELFGVITDKTYKLDISLITLKKDIAFIHGKKLEITGDLQEDGKKVKD